MAKRNVRTKQVIDNAEARAYLASTDWYIVRKQETGKDVPAEVLTKREEARLSVIEYLTAQ